MKLENKNHTFVVCAYGESEYLEECVLSLVHQKSQSRILISTSTPNSYIYSIAQKYEIPVIVNKGNSGLAEDWNFAYNCAKTPLVTLAHQDDRYYENYAADILEVAGKCKHPLIIFSDYNEAFKNTEIVEKSFCAQTHFVYWFSHLLSCGNFGER